MATIEGEDEYTISGSTECGGEATSTIKPGERFIAVELSYGKKDWAVYLRSGVSGTIPRNRIRVLPDEPLTKLKLCRLQGKNGDNWSLNGSRSPTILAFRQSLMAW